MREAPAWFNAELERIGGVNPYGEPNFKLVWSLGERMAVGGRFADGFEGYREKKLIGGPACWALMIWEPRELYGTLERWNRDYRDPETGLLDVGRYPIHGKYRLLQKFIHHEMTRTAVEEPFFDGATIKMRTITKAEFKVYRMEPCGLMLDLFVPILKAWIKLTDEAKIAAARQEEAAKQAEVSKQLKDAWEGRFRISRSSQLIQKRVEIVERGMKEAMRIASQTGLGMRQMPA